MNRYIFEYFTLKSNMQTGVTGDSRWPKDHPQITLKLPGHTYPPKILCAAFQMQYHKLSEPQRNETTQQEKLILNDWINGNTFWTINHKRALNAYHLSKYKMKIMKTHFTVQSSVTTKCVPLFQQ